MNEFQIIKKFFTKKITYKRPDVLLGIGDDCALLKIPAGQTLAITTDSLINGIHFPQNTNPSDIGHKAAARALSDLAAMGATPAWVTLNLMLPKADLNWLQKFAKGFFALLKKYQVQLIGGDTAHAPQLAIGMSAYGFVPEKQALKRSGAKPGDHVYVTGRLGDAGLALQILQEGVQVNSVVRQKVLTRFNRPQPQIAVGLQLRGVANSAIDISDGFAADLTHILQASKVGATVWVDKLPRLPEVSLPVALTAGDDYELCFTVAPRNEKKLLAALKKIKCVATRVGIVEAKLGLRLQHADGSVYRGEAVGYQHF